MKTNSYTGVKVEDTPDDIEAGKIYLIGNPIRSVLFFCPCGCGSRVHLNCVVNVKSKWKVINDNPSSVTIHPSVQKVDGCKSHFRIIDGKVV